MESLFISTGVVALAEIGDKTQLLAFILAARFKKPLPIILGIFCATIVNHGLAGALGAWITQAISPETLRWVLGVSFLGMAIWTRTGPDLRDHHLAALPAARSPGLRQSVEGRVRLRRAGATLEEPDRRWLHRAERQQRHLPVQVPRPLNVCRKAHAGALRSPGTSHH